MRWIGRVAAATGGEDGMTTAEYAVGTVAAVGFAGLLYKVVTSEPVWNALSGIVQRALSVTF